MYFLNVTLPLLHGTLFNQPIVVVTTGRSRPSWPCHDTNGLAGKPFGIALAETDVSWVDVC